MPLFIFSHVLNNSLMSKCDERCYGWENWPVIQILLYKTNKKTNKKNGNSLGCLASVICT